MHTRLLHAVRQTGSTPFLKRLHIDVPKRCLSNAPGNIKWVRPPARKAKRGFFRRWLRRIVGTGVVLTGASVAGAAYFASQVDEAKGETWQLLAAEALPARALSQAWGRFNSKELPIVVRVPMFHLWTLLFGVNLEEADKEIHEYRSLQEFFTRKLKPGSRPIQTASLVSPSDGRLTVFGDVRPTGTIDQVKGVEYKVSDLLGFTPVLQNKDSKLCYAVIYLAPGDYHWFHAPSDVQFTERTHFAGELFSVAPLVAKHVPNLFARNERVTLAGTWKHGFYSVTPVGAYNVGSISIECEPDLVTNRAEQLAAENRGNGVPAKVTYPEPIHLKKGDTLGRFNLGSTLVLVFEAPKSFRFRRTEGKVQMGQNLGNE